MKTGIILDEPNAIYHAQDAISSSKLADMRVAGEICPANYYQRHVSKSAAREHGAHFDIGIATHLRILEGMDAYDAACIIEPETYTNEKGEVKKWTMTANICKAWRAGCGGRLILSGEEASLIERLNSAVRSDDTARDLVSNGVPEVTFRKTFASGLTLQCRTDKWDAENNRIVDLKTCNTIEQFEREFYFLRYNFRAEFYRMVVAEVLADVGGIPVADVTPPDYVFVVVEKSTPHRVRLYRPDEEALAAGRKEIHADLKTLRECLALGRWSEPEQSIKLIGLKTWQLAKSDATSEEAINS